jgi:uroporphyrinogen-III decarboxylase
MLFQHNANCSGHTSGLAADFRAAWFPEDFYMEAAALGGAVRKTSTGFAVVEPVFENPASLRNLPALNEQPPVKQVLERIANAPAEPIPLLRANAPYSALAPLTAPTLFYRWLAKNPDDVLAGLDRITAGLYAYITAAFAKGVRILSLADPYADMAALGEERYRVFAGRPLVTLLKTLGAADFPGRVIHLCPRSSRCLERCGLVKSAPLPEAGQGKPYIELLSSIENQDILILGHQCIHTIEANRLAVLTPQDERSFSC